jgi:3-hydroxyacyl-[acyl-carrier-protein] dehydratase
MRWFWIDRFLEFQSGQSATAIKNVSLVEEHIDGYSPGYPMMANSLVVEGLAQAGGLLVGETQGFEQNVVLAKVSRARFHFSPRPGDALTYRVRMENMQADGALVSGTSHAGERLQAEIELYFALLQDRNGNRDMFPPADFMRLLRLFRLYDVAVDASGNPCVAPERLLAAERRDLAATANPHAEVRDMR